MVHVFGRYTCDPDPTSAQLPLDHWLHGDSPTGIGTTSHRQGGTKPYPICVPPHGLSPPSTQTWVLRDKISDFTSRAPLSWEDFPGGHPSWYYSRSGTLNCGVLMGSGAFVLNQLSGTRLVKSGILSLRTQWVSPHGADIQAGSRALGQLAGLGRTILISHEATPEIGGATVTLVHAFLTSIIT
ncbi:hypothetical protein Sjap_019064 [Stephania japonica]|uniref:Thioesterase domain-containing protein n=1 Tax=Stephania japonica TaxID=461633 RepID=A0AAP0F0U8_9MAGN